LELNSNQCLLGSPLKVARLLQSREGLAAVFLLETLEGDSQLEVVVLLLEVLAARPLRVVISEAWLLVLVGLVTLVEGVLQPGLLRF
jgi:hypothetical protein